MQLPSQASPNRCRQFTALVEKCDLPDESSPTVALAGNGTAQIATIAWYFGAKPGPWSETERDDESFDFWRNPSRPNRTDNHFGNFDLFSP